MARIGSAPPAVSADTCAGMPFASRLIAATRADSSSPNRLSTTRSLESGMRSNLTPGFEPPQRCRDDPIPFRRRRIVRREPERAERQLRDVGDLGNVELRDIVGCAVIFRMQPVEELHDRDAPFEIRAAVGTRAVEFA